MHPGFITISDASKILKVHPNTLRNWERKYILVPYRDKKTGYRYYSEKQIDTFLKHRSTGKSSLTWGYEEIDLERITELENIKEVYYMCMSSPLFPIFDKTKNELYKSLLHKAKERGVQIRLLTEVKNSQLRRFAKDVNQFSIETRTKKLDGISFVIIDNDHVAIEVTNETPEKWLRIQIKNKRVAEQFSVLFEKIWKASSPISHSQKRSAMKYSSLPTSRISFP